MGIQIDIVLFALFLLIVANNSEYLLMYMYIIFCFILYYMQFSKIKFIWK